MPHLSWSPKTFDDFDRLYAHLVAVKSRATALRALMDIQSGARILETFPLLGRRVPGHISRREWVVRFGHGAYIVIYEVKTDTVIILTVRHSREAPAPAR
ncbi:plasmid stabilization system protein [Terriglobus roseus DSM 18391]|uniref:Plasmid stabilization system protein n=1 Tax=Terriglobus roseus (strain DSM 18391 / NRRL B-41598 / KBS 63) TaxID=926566 RepID=I3ZEP5_TERRK|nr:type II toxin-antitoxin system RelE/ParE family toxin [Terriglobus roseus]AFL87713.1 plasmid stabilization system protein [Terriglobus roseus DSM 18391]